MILIFWKDKTAAIPAEEITAAYMKLIISYPKVILKDSFFFEIWFKLIHTRTAEMAKTFKFDSRYFI